MFAVHLAYRVILPDVAKFFTVDPFVYSIAPVLVLLHPANVYPVLVNAFFVNVQSLSYVHVIVSILPVPPLLLNAILYVFAVNTTYTVLLG